MACNCGRFTSMRATYDCAADELPDFLPLMLEFVSVCPRPGIPHRFGSACSLPPMVDHLEKRNRSMRPC